MFALRFVLLLHTPGAGAGKSVETHWDLMIERAPGGTLATWRLAQDPTARATCISATTLGDHRRLYLDYEGPLSDDRGYVRQIDAGTATFMECEAGCARGMLAGHRLSGPFSIENHEGELRFRLG